jgi:hypothetical protein
MRRTLFPVVLASAVLGVALAGGCGGKVSGPSTAAPIALADYCEAFATARCALYVPCCTQLGYALDTTSCHATALTACKGEVASALAAGEVFDPSSAGACLAGLDALASGCAYVDLSTPAATRELAVCNSTWRGTRPLGASCDTGAECIKPTDGSGVVCDRSTPTPSGVCTLHPLGKVGEACGDNLGLQNQGCEAGLACVYLPTSFDTCVRLGDVGDACVASVACKDGLRCDVATHACARAGEAGAACVASDDRSCNSASYCDATASVCRPRHPLGASCAASGDYAACDAGTYCDGNTLTCVALKPLGASCSLGLECTSRHCNPSRLGSGFECATGSNVVDGDACAHAGGAP